MPEPTDSEKLDMVILELRRVKERLKLTAKAVADLSLGLSSAQIASRNRDGETHGLILGLRSELAVGPAPRERKNSEDHTDSFKLPGGGGDKIELTRRTQKKLIRWVLVGLFAVALHAVQFVWERAAEHRPLPPPVQALPPPPH
jgi:hypothetical protein